MATTTLILTGIDLLEGGDGVRWLALVIMTFAAIFTGGTLTALLG